MNTTSSDWREASACSTANLINIAPEIAGRQADVFFPVGSTSSARNQRAIAQAKAVCAQCPVRSECLADALDAPHEAGAWHQGRDPRRRRIGIVGWTLLVLLAV
ncbi:WhiB family transcriptional regulator, partial [Streptomyces sp. NPDC051173]|uniref:WhiB family transcriptional regulator n=1 Tax=Streptomyces sp. NPDC051173 TaxID=3155164 RepID=UPI00344B10F2